MSSATRQLQPLYPREKSNGNKELWSTLVQFQGLFPSQGPSLSVHVHAKIPTISTCFSSAVKDFTFSVLHFFSMPNRKYYFLILSNAKLRKQNCESKITNGLDVPCFSRQNTCWMHSLGTQWPGWPLLLCVYHQPWVYVSSRVQRCDMPTCQHQVGLRLGLYSSFHRKAMQAQGSDAACNTLWQAPSTASSSLVPPLLWWAQRLG